MKASNERQLDLSAVDVFLIFDFAYVLWDIVLAMTMWYEEWKLLATKTRFKVWS